MNEKLVEEEQSTTAPAQEILLGPFLGYVTSSTIRIWLHLEGGPPELWVTAHPGNPFAEPVAREPIKFDADRMFTGWTDLGALTPDTKYFYRFWTNPAASVPFAITGLTDDDLHFWTLSEDPDAQIDFVVMSCHNPTVAGKDGFDGHAIWADIPQIISRHSNRNVRFALLVGDQVYADEWQNRILREPAEEGRLKLYLEAYRLYWSNIYYRRVMCRLPAVMIWDDHDITDGWGSEEKSFEGDSPTFKPEWQGLFEAAFKTFCIMQASRNPPPLAENPRDGLDFAFRAGRWGFLFLDLRTNRNWRRSQLITEEQSGRIRAWVEANREAMSTLFVISPVVFSHGSPLLENYTVKAWPYVMWVVDKVAGMTRWGKGLQTRFWKSVGDIRDDIRDSWSSPENASQADAMLDYLFGLQNAKKDPVAVVVISGDIHTSGYANIYSSDPAHTSRPTIPHITSSSVSYTPFNWLLEAIYRHSSKTIQLGKKGSYSSQVSHHFTSRSVAVLSLRPMKIPGDFQLKVKYYLEGYPEPQTLIFDLEQTSHREDISWAAQERLFAREYAPTTSVNVDALLREKASAAPKDLNWQESIVDLMKLFGLDSGLDARKRLARAWGYEGKLEGSERMNLFLHREIIRRFIAAGGSVPGGLDALPTADSPSAATANASEAEPET
ncbi:DUF3597 family protein [Sphingomonas sp.]|jgi:phosphodiesterase/alkaline phosphatase D-like protein|uniref:DUF3597 family protein n=1 Tax=Sphingomonas sp. TaxID=28214 RepID=UPI001824D279|nr:DUF3597 family protein [Sphingomonas sp.]MBA3512306.1 DUF3597 family protein [Sphingomonas sp.]